VTADLKASLVLWVPVAEIPAQPDPRAPKAQPALRVQTALMELKVRRARRALMAYKASRDQRVSVVLKVNPVQRALREKVKRSLRGLYSRATFLMVPLRTRTWRMASLDPRRLISSAP
jgi:hypothetical protein